MLKYAFAAAAALLVSACGTQMGDRMASGAAIGAGAGFLVGGIGALPGAAIGAAAAAFSDPDELNLGDPVWNEEEGRYEDKKPG